MFPPKDERLIEIYKLIDDAFQPFKKVIDIYPDIFQLDYDKEDGYFIFYNPTDLEQTAKFPDQVPP